MEACGGHNRRNHSRLFSLARSIRPTGLYTLALAGLLLSAPDPGAAATPHRSAPTAPVETGPASARFALAPQDDTLRSGPVTVTFPAGRDALAGRVLRSFAGIRTLPGMPEGADPDVTVVLAADELSFLAEVGGAVPEWGAAVALPSEGRVIIPAYASDRSRGRNLDQLVRHEWAHVALGRYLDGLRVPRWFHEGYAEWASGGFDAQEGWRLRLLLALGRTPPLDSLSLDWPADRASADAAYLLSASAIEYLARASGPDGIALFLTRWREEGAFEQAFRATFGRTTGQFEEDWAAYVRSRYGWLLLLSHSLVFWSVAAVLSVLLVLLRRRRGRERLARLRAADPPPTPAYWTDGTAVDPNTSEGGGYSENRAPPSDP